MSHSHDEYDSHRQTGRQELRKTSEPVVIKQSINGNVILLVKRILDVTGQPQQTVVDIMHEPLRQLLADINRNVEGVQLTTQNPTVYMGCITLLLS